MWVRRKFSYRETILSEGKGEGKFVRQGVGMKGQYGHCVIKLAPTERGKGFVFINKLRDGVIPKQYIPQLRRG